MGLVQVLLLIIVPVLFIVGLGCLSQRRLQLSPAPFSRLTLCVLSPALVFSSLAESRLLWVEVVPLALVVFLLTWLLSGLR